MSNERSPRGRPDRRDRGNRERPPQKRVRFGPRGAVPGRPSKSTGMSGNRGPSQYRDRPAQVRKPGARELALETLCRFDEVRVGRIADLEQDLVIEGSLDARGRSFFHELVYGTLRRRLTLDCVIASFSRDPLSRIDVDCLNALRLGVYQLLFLDGVPPFAAIKETVDLMSRRHSGVGSLVNAILRSVSRETKKVDVDEDHGGASPRKRLVLSDQKVAFFTRSVFVDPAENTALHLAQVHSHPPFLVERWLEHMDQPVVEGVLAAGNARPSVCIRVNRLRSDTDGLRKRLVSEGLDVSPGGLSESLRIDASPADLVATQAFAEGLFYVQDEAAMKVAPVLVPRAGERILDLCAAPGGKSTHLAELAADRAEVLAVDRDATRLRHIAENVARLGLKSVTPLCFDLLAEHDTDQRQEHLAGPFDAALVDVPCSNTGVLARRPEVRWRVSVDAIRELAERGRRLLREAAHQVRPGGRVLFSTCSLEREENADAVARVLVAEPDLRFVRQEETLPQAGGQDGGYFALIERVSP